MYFHTLLLRTHTKRSVYLWGVKSSSYLLLHYIESFQGSKGQFFNGVLLNYQVGALFITHRLDSSTWTKQAEHTPLKIPLKQKSGVIGFYKEGLAIKYRDISLGQRLRCIRMKRLWLIENYLSRSCVTFENMKRFRFVSEKTLMHESSVPCFWVLSSMLVLSSSENPRKLNTQSWNGGTLNSVRNSSLPAWKLLNQKKKEKKKIRH